MLWVKAFHIVFVASWFAALFYLPRILVNLAQVSPNSLDEYQRLLGMGRRLYRFGMILMVVALVLGLWLWLGFGVGTGQGWMHAKLALVVVVLAYQHVTGRYLRQFESVQPGQAPRSQRWFRFFNEISVLLFSAIVVLATVKPW